MAFSLDKLLGRNKKEEWVPTIHDLIDDQLDAAKGVFIGLNKPKTIRGLKLVLALTLLVALKEKISHSSEAGLGGDVSMQASMGSFSENSFISGNSFSLPVDEIKKAVNEAVEDNDAELKTTVDHPEKENSQKNESVKISTEAPENLPIEHSQDESSEVMTSAVISETAPSSETGSQINETSHEAEPIVNREAISRMNQKAQAFAEGLNIFAQGSLVGDIRSNYDAILKYARGEGDGVLKEGGKNFKELVKIFGEELNSFDPVTRKTAAQEIKEMADIVKNNDLGDISKKLAAWAKK